MYIQIVKTINLSSAECFDLCILFSFFNSNVLAILAFSSKNTLRL